MRGIFLPALVISMTVFSQWYGYNVKYDDEGRKINYGRRMSSYGMPAIEDILHYDFRVSRDEFRQAVTKGAKTAFNVRVVDEDFNPVGGAEVLAYMRISNDISANSISSVTNKDGVAHIDGICDGYASFFVRKKGWYDSASTRMTYFFKNLVSLENGKWQPYNTEYNIVLRKRKNPLDPGLVKPVFFSHKFPVDDGTIIGVDLFAKDWVKPYGKGVTADFLLKYSMVDDGNEKVLTLLFSFPNPEDGIYEMPYDKMSAFKTQYAAFMDDTVYRRNFEIQKKFYCHYFGQNKEIKEYFPYNVEGNIWNKETYLVLRTRTKLDEKGNIVSCNYSKITGKILLDNGEIDMHWVANPTPNDNNLEEFIDEK